MIESLDTEDLVSSLAISNHVFLVFQNLLYHYYQYILRHAKKRRKGLLKPHLLMHFLYGYRYCLYIITLIKCENNQAIINIILFVL